MGAPIKLVAGNSNRALAEAVATYLKIPMTKCSVRRFADMEVFVEIQENVRGQDVFVLQSTSFPANDHLMELLIIIDERLTFLIVHNGSLLDGLHVPLCLVLIQLVLPVVGLLTHAACIGPILIKRMI